MSSSEMKRRNKQRSTGKLVVLNEEELIRQVTMRPTLYDRTLKSYRKATLRLHAWNEVSVAMGASVEECRRRWRSLRDAFTKHYKRSVTEDGKPTKRKKWVFYDQMSFMARFLDHASSEIDEHFLDDFEDNSDDILLARDQNNSIGAESPEEHDNRHEDNGKGNSACTDDNVNKRNDLEDRKYVASLLQDSTMTMQASDFLSIREDSPMLRTADVGDMAKDDDEEQIKDGCISARAVYGSGSVAELDSDEKFLLSCAPVLRRLTHRKNALARLKIQQILYDVEFGTIDG